MSQDASLQTHPTVLEPQSAGTSAAVRDRQPSPDQTEDAMTPSTSPDPSALMDDRHGNVSDNSDNYVQSTSLDPQSYVEAIANETLQDVFDDVDRMLTNKSIVRHQSSENGAGADSTADFSVSSLNSGGALAPLGSSQSADASLSIPDLDVHDEPLVGNPASTPERFRTFLMRLSLIVAASVTMGIGLAFWMAQRNRAELATVPTNTAPPTASDVPTAAPPELADGSFEQYFQDALATIDRRYEQEESEDVTDDSLLLPPPPPPPTSGNPPLVVDRGYIDVYRQSQGSATPPVATATPANPAPAPVALAPAPAPTPSVNSAPAPVQNITPSSTHTLVGILELGDRSAAIFEYSGSAHRIEVGEQIGGSGWSLVSVSGQEAIIRRNGEVRSIYMEQSF